MRARAGLLARVAQPRGRERVWLSDLWLTVHRTTPGQADVPFIYDFRLHGAAAGT